MVGCYKFTIGITIVGDRSTSSPSLILQPSLEFSTGDSNAIPFGSCTLAQNLPFSCLHYNLVLGLSRNILAPTPFAEAIAIGGLPMR